VEGQVAPISVLILSSGAFAASRRIVACIISWFETALKKRLLTMRSQMFQ
jgi:hypothetical protein